MMVLIIMMRSTGEVWHTAVAANRQAVRRVLFGHGITERVYGTEEAEYQEWESPTDRSQTATVRSVVLIGAEVQA